QNIIPTTFFNATTWAAPWLGPIGTHRVASIASGGLDTLPRNGAVITLLAATGPTRRESYKDLFAITQIATTAAIFIIGVFYATGIVSLPLRRRQPAPSRR